MEMYRRIPDIKVTNIRNIQAEGSGTAVMLGEENVEIIPPSSVFPLSKLKFVKMVSDVVIIVVPEEFAVSVNVPNVTEVPVTGLTEKP